jgi:hypothetical protein
MHTTSQCAIPVGLLIADDCAIEALMARYGLELDFGSGPALAARHGLRNEF